MLSLPFRRLFLLTALIPLLCGSASAEAPLPPEAHPRAGLPHVAAKLSAAASSASSLTSASELRVAFLGGSITAAKGWRTGILADLRRTYPQTHFTEIFAALPGTGSDFGAARVREDVLRHVPDLLFVEFAVNDTDRAPAAIRRSMEGIVRQTRRHAPGTDLCFVYTLSFSALPDLEGGRYPESAAAMEEIADHYGIPSLHFGVEVVRQLRAGALVFTGEAPSRTVPIFAPDKIHPGTAGHRLYTESLARQLPAFLNAKSASASAWSTSASASPLPAPLEPANWENARIVPLSALPGRTADRSAFSAWTPVPDTDLRLSAIPAELRRETFTTTRPGPVLEFTFTGTAFGLAGIKGPDAGRFRVTIDDRPPLDATLFDTFCLARRYRARPWFYPADLAAGSHTVRIELLAEGPDKSSARAASKESDPAFDLNALTLSGVILVE